MKAIRLHQHLMFAIFLLAAFAFTPKLSAQTTGQILDHYGDCAGESGVEMIPFPGLYKTTAAIAKEVQRKKAETRQYNYDAISKEKNIILKAIAKGNESIKKTESLQAQHERDYPGTDNEHDDDLKDLQEQLKKDKTKLGAINERIEDAMEATRRLWNARGGLREAFDDVIDDLDKVYSYPMKYLKDGANDDDASELKTHVRKIKDKIKREVGNHKDQEDDTKALEGKYKTLLGRDRPF